MIYHCIRAKIALQFRTREVFDISNNVGTVNTVVRVWIWQLFYDIKCQILGSQRFCHWFIIGQTCSCHEGKIDWVMGLGIWLMITVEPTSLLAAHRYLHHQGQSYVPDMSKKIKSPFSSMLLDVTCSIAATVVRLGGKQTLRYKVSWRRIWDRNALSLAATQTFSYSNMCSAAKKHRAYEASNCWSSVALRDDSQLCRVSVICGGKMQVMSVATARTNLLYRTLYSFLYPAQHPRVGYSDRRGTEMDEAKCDHLWNEKCVLFFTLTLYGKPSGHRGY